MQASYIVLVYMIARLLLFSYAHSTLCILANTGSSKPPFNHCPDSTIQLEIVFTIAARAFDILFIGCVLNTKIAYTTSEKLRLKPFIELQILQDATRRSRSSKATKQTRTRRCNTFKCCKMLLEDEGDERCPSGCKYPTPPCALAKILPETTVRA